MSPSGNQTHESNRDPSSNLTWLSSFLLTIADPCSNPHPSLSLSGCKIGLDKSAISPSPFSSLRGNRNQSTSCVCYLAPPGVFGHTSAERGLGTRPRGPASFQWHLKAIRVHRAVEQLPRACLRRAGERGGGEKDA